MSHIMENESTIAGFEGNGESKENLHCRDIDECAHQNLYIT